MVIGQAPTDRSTEKQQRQQHRRNDKAGVRRHLAHILDHPPLIPAINADEKHQIIEQRVRNRRLDLRHHGARGLALGVFRPRAAVLLDHAHQLDVAGHDGGDRGEQPRA
jgi:hypothetical protein